MPATKKGSSKKTTKVSKPTVNWMTLSFAIAISAVLLSGIVVWQLRDKFMGNWAEEGAHPQISLVRVYFSNMLKSSGTGQCDQVFPVGRVVSADRKIEASLEELLNGPTSREKNTGFTSFFSDKTKSALKNIRVVNGVVYLNLNDIRRVIPNASSSCGSAQLLVQIDTTAKQFSEVKKVIVAIDGKPSVFYDWIQVGCTKENNNCDETPFK